jgi:hypothetical protein
MTEKQQTAGFVRLFVVGTGGELISSAPMKKAPQERGF